MNTETADNCKNVVAFLTARANDDLEAGKVLADSCEATMKLLLGMTDFALAQLKVMAEIVGVDLMVMIETMGMANTMILDRILRGRE